MKIFALYYNETFVVAYPTREDCVAFGKQHYDGWDCAIIEKFIVNSITDTFPINKPIPYPWSIPPHPQPYTKWALPCTYNIH
jgi:hypothetical protein